MKNKRFLSLLLSALMVLTMLPLTVQAATTHQVGSASELKTLLDSGTLVSGDTIELTATVTDYVYSVVIDKEITFDVGDYTLNITNSAPGGAALEVDGGAVHLEATGGALNVSVTGEHGKGVVAYNGGTAVVTNAEATGTNSSAALAYDGTIEVDRDVTAEGNFSYGAYVQGSGLIQVGGDVTAEGDGSMGVTVYSGGTVEVEGSVSAEGGGCSGIYARGDNTTSPPKTSTVSVNGTVSADGLACKAILAEQNCIIKVDGDVSADGDYSTGMNTDNNNSITVNGSVSVEGKECRGLYSTVYSDSTVTVSAEDGISVNGDGSTGLYAEGDGTFEVSGDITAAGDDSFGMYLFEGGTVTLEGNITVTGENSIGAAAYGGSTDIVNGTISAPVYVGVNAIRDSSFPHDIISYITKTEAGGVPGTGTYADYLVYTDTDPDPDSVGAGTVYVRKASPTNYTITASAGSGGSISPSGTVSVAAGGSQTFTITPNSNYRIDAVRVDDTNQGTISSYTFTNVTGNHTISATFSYTSGDSDDDDRGNSGGRDRSPSTPATPLSNAGLIPIKDLTTDRLQETIVIENDIAKVVIPSNMLAGIPGMEGKQAEITIGNGDKSGLPDNVKAAVGDRPLIQLTLSIDGKQTNWSNPDAPVTVSIPYTPTAEELAHPESIVVWYIDGSGNVVTVPNGHYDPKTGMVTFDVTHFSLYAVVYNRVSFNDVASDAWYAPAVSFIAAREITTGTDNGNFGHDAKLTRGGFLVMLMKAYGIEPEEKPTDNFADAGNTYYTNYLAAAKRLGISGGIGNNMYAPEKEIARQEMFTLIYNALKAIGQLPAGNSGKTLSSFTDSGQIDTWAQEAMTLMVRTGIAGGNNGMLTPAGTTTRAEMAQVLYNLLRK